MMDPAETWRRIDDLFAQAIELPTAERAAFVAACDDPAVRDELASLLASAPGARDRLVHAVTSTASSLAHDLDTGYVGQRLGAYRVLGVIGEGGMGTVYRAERDDGTYQQTVAIKVLQHGLASPQVIARFRDERQILAGLDHPAIVRLLDGGTTADGLPYLVMEHVDGTPLTRYARGRPVRERVALVRRVCDALAYAHQRLVVHRDVKPSNVLVTGDGAPKLLDFGIAKLLEPTVTSAAEARTRTGLSLFTPEYASPEQARGERVTVATDVYSTGAVLYELLTGRPPHRTRPDDHVLTVLKTICEVDPPRPSAVAPVERRELAGDLDNIVLRALHKDPARRYASVAELADDLDRYLDGRPVRARDATLRYRAGKFVGRHRVALAIATVVAAALTVATIVSIVQARRATRAAYEARRLLRTSLAEQGRQELAAGHAGRALPYLIEAWRLGNDTAGVRFLVAEARRPFERTIARVTDLSTGVTAIAWAPDGSAFVAVGQLGRVRVFDPDGRPLARLDRPRPVVQRVVSYRDDGAYLASVGYDGVVTVWRASDTRVRELFAIGDAIWHVLWLDDDRLVTCAESAVRAWDLATGARVWEQRTPGPTYYCAATPGSARVFTGTRGGLVTEWDARTGAHVRDLPRLDVPVAALATSPDGARLYVAGGTRVLVWDVPGARVVATLDGHVGEVHALDVSRDGAHVVVGTRRGGVSLWDARAGARRLDVDGHVGSIQSVWFSHDSARVITTATDNRHRVVDVATGAIVVEHETTPVGGSEPHALAVTHDGRLSPDGSRVLSAAGAELVVWRPERAPLELEIQGSSGFVGGALAPTGDRVVALGAHGVAAAWSLVDGARIATFDIGVVKPYDAAWSPDGAAVVIVGEDGYAAVFPAAGGPPLRRLVGHARTINNAELSPDGAHLATCSDDRTARVWDVASGAELRSLRHPNRCLGIAWTSDGRTLATAGWDGALRVWDASTGALRAEIVASAEVQFLDLSFTPDERGLVAGEHDGRISVWDLATRARVAALEGHTGPGTWVRHAPGGGLLASTGDDLTARIWDPVTGKQLTTLPHTGSVMYGLWAGPDRLVTFDVAGYLRVWRLARAEGDAAEAAAFVDARVPWRLVDGRLERRALPPTR